MVLSSAEKNRIRTRAWQRSLSSLRARHRDEFDAEFAIQLARAQAESEAVHGPDETPISDVPAGLGRALAAG